MTLGVLALLGGFLGLDGTSVGQFMVSRPLVAATLTGLLLGDPISGFVGGAILEFFFLPMFAVGGARFPESGPAAVAAGAAAVWIPQPAGLAVAVLLGLGLGEVGGFSVMVLRRVNGRLAADPVRDRVTPEAVVRAHVVGIVLDFFRATLLTLAGVSVAWAAGGVAPGIWPLNSDSTVGLLVAGVSVPLGMLLRGFQGWQRHRWKFAGGLAGGVLLAMML